MEQYLVHEPWFSKPGVWHDMSISSCGRSIHDYFKKDPISAPVIVIDEVLQQSKWQEFDSISTRQVGDSPERSTQSENNLRFIVRTSQEMSQGEGVHTSCHSRPRACQRF